ncbi:hypothetical protein H4R33_002975 [Dimargaris cristalligena]|uniref:Dihydrolipoamide acetyltransferase component of pyruvate dehydrogenase complex n=1 Tax=Dimargaris cristalligena TaxID=215637 RepID=A0A4P9ZZW9_9FUNG|nr:hypothetical protein H4R33_002975 [Dimargaris cristalligena]RKP39344.1 2-oxoacid dehydrogenases acyltransferase-domain-containing protein [Dimargaris cristalligena]|eukprot:RKP39344.1 2-oxoacid dehydrogenases acyltransferase-domain-containing protein [Dimargaris cristalligena]
MFRLLRDQPSCLRALQRLTRDACLTRPLRIGLTGPTASRLFHTSGASHKVVPFNLADIGEGITECEIIQWFVKPGDTIAQFDKICEVQSDKASVEITSRYDGRVSKLYYDAGAVANVGKPLVDIEVGDEGGEVDPELSEPASAPKVPPPTPSAPAPSTSPSIPPQLASTAAQDIIAIPAVRRLAKEHSLNLAHIQGTGKGGRITKEDVLNHLNEGPAAQSPPAPSASATLSMAGSVEERPLANIERAMYKSMTASRTIPDFIFTDELELDTLMGLRQQLNGWLTASGQAAGGPGLDKVSYMPFMIKALSLALAKYPILNAAILHEDQGADRARIQFRASHNIALAMDTPQGLIVPNIKDVQAKTLLEVAQELQRLVAAGKRNGLGPADMKHATITLSNVGMIGGTKLGPVVPSGTMCIGAIGKIQRLPRFDMVTDPITQVTREVVVPKHIVNVSWAADHRVVDGATMARFAVYWQSILQNPGLFLAQLK